LPGGETSGLDEAVSLLASIEDVGHCTFTAADVVRHELVSRIVSAYDAADAAKSKKRKEKRP
jgi:phosphate starvation-inducible PhoH-like protein